MKIISVVRGEGNTNSGGENVRRSKRGRGGKKKKSPINNRLSRGTISNGTRGEDQIGEECNGWKERIRTSSKKKVQNGTGGV